MKIIRCITIPPSNEKNYSHDLTIIWPFGGLYFVTLFFFPLQKWQIFLMPICLGISILFCKYNSGSVDEIPRYFIFLTFILVVQSFGPVTSWFLQSLPIDHTRLYQIS